jgi:hypothetical protein
MGKVVSPVPGLGVVVCMVTHGFRRGLAWIALGRADMEEIICGYDVGGHGSLYFGD